MRIPPSPPFSKGGTSPVPAQAELDFTTTPPFEKGGPGGIPAHQGARTTAAWIENLELLAEAPGGVRALRRLVMDLAIAGRLVPQIASDGSAAAVLQATAVLRTTTPRTGRLTRTGSLADADRGTLPEGWVATTVGEVLICRDGERIPVAQVDRESRAKLYDYYGASGIIDKIDSFLFDKPLLLVGEDGANLINRSTPIAFIARGKYWVNNHAHVLDGLDEDLLRYMALFFNAIDLKPYVTGTAQPKLNQAKLNAIPVDLPPLAEQHRIVAKVDELMALCDRLEARQTDAQRAHARLVQALLDSLTQARDAGEFQAAWERVAGCFEGVLSNESSIDQLRKSSIKLAMTGKLSSTESRSTWRKIKVADAGKIKLGRQRSPKDHWGPNMTPYLRVANVHEAKINTTDIKEMNFSPEEQETFRLHPGDILLNEGQSKELVGRPALYKGEVPGACFQNTLLRFRCNADLLPEYALKYFQYCMHSGIFQRAAQQTTNIAHLSAGRLSSIEFLLPPLKEQARILAQLDELLALCDQLKAGIVAARAKQAQLAEALVKQAVATAAG